jgi:hypothetical protein
MEPEIYRLYLSPGHNFFGHHGREPDNFPAIEVPALDCVRGRGIRGDRSRSVIHFPQLSQKREFPVSRMRERQGLREWHPNIPPSRRGRESVWS